MRQVTVYVGNNCGACDTLLDWMRGQGVSPTVKNIHTDIESRQMIMALGLRGVPITIVQGYDPVVGLEIGKLEKMIRDEGNVTDA